MNEQRIGHLVPLNTRIQVNVEFSPAAQPEALVDVGLGVVIVVLTTQDAVEPHSVGDAEHRGIEVDDTPAQLIVDVSLTGRITQAGTDLGGMHKFAITRAAELYGRRLVERAEGHLSAGLILLTLSADGSLQAPVGLILEGDLLAVVEHHLVGLGPLQCNHEVILVSVHEAVAGRTHVLADLNGHGAARELVGHVLLGVQRVSQLSHVVVLTAAPAVTVVARKEEVLVQVGRSFQTQSRAPPVNIIVRKNGVHRTDVNVVWRARLNGVLEEGLQDEDDVLHALDVLDAVNELVHGALALGELHLSVLLPELFVAHLSIGFCHLFGHALEEFIRQRVEAIVRQTGGTRHGGASHEAHQAEVGGHVVL